jgi:hypothetical protein
LNAGTALGMMRGISAMDTTLLSEQGVCRNACCVLVFACLSVRILFAGLFRCAQRILLRLSQLISSFHLLSSTAGVRAAFALHLFQSGFTINSEVKNLRQPLLELYFALSPSISIPVRLTVFVSFTLVGLLLFACQTGSFMVRRRRASIRTIARAWYVLLSSRDGLRCSWVLLCARLPPQLAALPLLSLLRASIHPASAFLTSAAAFPSVLPNHNHSVCCARWTRARFRRSLRT